MKRTNNMLLAALAGIALSLFVGSAQAQYKPTGADGIAASPRARQALDEFNRNHSPAPASAEVAKMACPKCKNEYSTHADLTVRGVNKPLVTVVKHLCEGCDTTATRVGVGKHASYVTAHKCTSCGSENMACCNTAKDGNVATTGMGAAKDIDVAPLK